MRLAYAHSGLEADETVSLLHLLDEWTLDPTFLVPLLIAVFYLKGVRRHRRNGGRSMPWWRPVLLLTGLAVVALCLLGPLDLLADLSFTFHMVQHDLITLVGVPLMLLGAPFVPTVRGLPARFRQRVFVPCARARGVQAVLRFLTRPAVGLIVYVLTYFVWHYPALYDAALASLWVHYLQHFCFVMAAVLFWWHIITPHPFPSRMHHLARVFVLFLSAIANSLLGAMISLSGDVLYGYAALGGFMGMSALQDQQIGGLLMWVMGGMLRLLAILLVLAAYARAEQAREPYRAVDLTPAGA